MDSDSQLIARAVGNPCPVYPGCFPVYVADGKLHEFTASLHRGAYIDVDGYLHTHPRPDSDEHVDAHCLAHANCNGDANDCRIVANPVT